MGSSVDKPEDDPAANKEGEPPAGEGTESEGSKNSPPEAPPSADDTVDMTKDRPLQRSESLNFRFHYQFLTPPGLSGGE